MTGVDKNELATLILEGSSSLNQLEEGDEDVSITAIMTTSQVSPLKIVSLCSPHTPG